VCVCVWLCVVVLSINTYTHTNVCRGPRTRTDASDLTKMEKRKLFTDGAYTARVAPLNPFVSGLTWNNFFPNGWGDVIQSVEDMSTRDRKNEVTLRTWARGEPMQPVPYPTTEAGVQLCHGAWLNFDERPPHLHSAIALRRWLKSRNVPYSMARRRTYLGKLCA